jgi:NhaA family Na+:H+ antiporter
LPIADTECFDDSRSGTTFVAVRLRKIQPSIFQRFFRTETVGGLVLLFFAIAALILANSPLAEAYEQIWTIPLTVGIGNHSLSLTLHEWINEGLMAVFFLLV